MSRNPEHALTNRRLPLDFLNCSLRICLIPLSIANFWLTVTNHQDNTNYGKLGFTNLGGLEYMAFISAISAGYALFAAFSWCIKFLVAKTWFFFISDQVIAYLMVTSMAAVMEILYLAYNGDQTVTWSESCSSYGKFCSKMKMALALHAMTLCCFILLAVISAYRVFSLFQPPYVLSKEIDDDEEEEKM
ncbi:hypothetical protein ACFE04_004928 [Oxalis oulophora]